MFKVNNKDTVRHHLTLLRIFIFSFEHFVNFEHIENFYLQGLLVFLNKSTGVSYIYQQTKS